jgi:hypothetical protein
VVSASTTRTCLVRHPWCDQIWGSAGGVYVMCCNSELQTQLLNGKTLYTDCSGLTVHESRRACFKERRKGSFVRLPSLSTIDPYGIVDAVRMAGKPQAGSCCALPSPAPHQQPCSLLIIHTAITGHRSRPVPIQTTLPAQIATMMSTGMLGEGEWALPRHTCFVLTGSTQMVSIST